MGLALPSDEAIAARALQLGLVGAGEAIPSDVRRRVARILQDEAAAPAPPPAGPVLLSRSRYEAVGGHLQVDVTFIPTPQEGSTNV